MNIPLAPVLKKNMFADSAQFAGSLDNITPGGLTGWLVRMDNPLMPTLLVARIGGRMIASGETGLSRPDVSAAIYRDGPAPAELRPGFQFRPDAEALAALAAQHRGDDAPLELQMTLSRGPQTLVLPCKLPARPAARWVQALEPCAVSGGPPMRTPFVHGGKAYSSLADFETWPLLDADAAAALAGGPFFDPDHYCAEARRHQVPLAQSLQQAEPALVLAHFCGFGLARGVQPHPAFGFDRDTGATEALAFFRSWAEDVPQAPSGEVTRAASTLQEIMSETGPEASVEEGLRAWAQFSGILGQDGDAAARFEPRLEHVWRAEELSRRPLGQIISQSATGRSDEELARAIADLRATGAFDAPYYLDNNSDVAASGADPLVHYVRNGEREGRRPRADFDPKFYLQLNADVGAAMPNAFLHFVQFGRAEGRLGMPRMHRPLAASLGDPILLVGHSSRRAGAERVLLTLVKWLHEHTRRKVTVYLMEGGGLLPQFSNYAEIIAAPADPLLDLALRRKLMREHWGMVYLNTVIAGGFLNDIAPRDVARQHVVAHLHEMKQVLEQHDDEFTHIRAVADYIVSASPATTQTLIEDYDRDPDRIGTVPAFIEPVAQDARDRDRLRGWARTELGLAADARVVMGCGSLYWRKGPDVFVETAIALNRAIARAGPGAGPVHFVWIGGGEDREGLEHLVRMAGLEAVIHFTGERPDAASLLAASDLFFLSSREDPFPLVCMEAAQYATPTLFVSGTTGINLFVTPEDDVPGGWALADFDPQTAADLIRQAFADPQEIGRRGTAALTRLFSRYTAARNCEKIFAMTRDAVGMAPVISVIVPNYNHAAYLPERLQSILDQTMKDYELIVLDDCSTDDSLDVVGAILRDFPGGRIVPNQTNSGGVFRQWQKGLGLARGRYVWIAESDDWCNKVFLETLCQELHDDGVVIATGKTIPTFKGKFDSAAMQGYLNSQCPRLFDSRFVLDGDVFVNIGMGAACLLVNASGILMRTDVARTYVSRGQDYRMAGDWVIYLHILRQGRIAYRPEAENYFRRHETSTVHEIEGTSVYFDERRRIADLVYDLYAVGKSLHGRILSTLQHEVDRFQHKSPGLTLAEVAPDRAPTLRMRRRVAFYVHGMLFSKGGIERLAAQLANHLVSTGFEVHILCRRWGSQQPIYPLHSGVHVAPVFNEDHQDHAIADVHAYLVRHNIEIFVPMLSEWLFEPLVEAGRRAGVTMIASEHNDPWQIEERFWSRDRRQETFAKVDHVHVLSPVFVSSLDPELQGRAVAIPNGVDLDVFHPPEKRPDAPSLKLVTAGRLARQKRMDIVIDAFARSGLAGQGWTLDIYGSGEEAGALAARIQTLQMTGAITLRGAHADMRAAFAEATLSVLASDFEGFGLVAVEAMACGVPVVAFADCNGLNEIIEDGISGALVDPGDGDRAEAMARRLAELGRDPQALMARADACVARAQKFSLTRFLQLWEEFLDRGQKVK